MDEPQDRVLLLTVCSSQTENIAYSLEELNQLAAACDLAVVGEVVQNLPRPHTGHYIGRGKAEEIALYIAEQQIDLVITGDELSNIQIRNLENLLDCTVIDRTQLILNIFARRTRSKEAKLQVDLAELQYMLPRLIGMRASLSRQGGGSSLRNRGAGETKLELDRRKIEKRIAMLKRELEDIVRQRAVKRKQREKNGLPVVALIGYTNTGKSTIMNALIEQFHPTEDKTVLEKDMLFATLDTSIRRIKLPDNQVFLLSDTVGFVSKLPHLLVESFRSTL